MNEATTDHLIRVLESIDRGQYVQNQLLQDQNRLLEKMMDGIREWKDWDKKHHLEEVETKKLIQTLLSK